MFSSGVGCTSRQIQLRQASPFLQPGVVSLGSQRKEGYDSGKLWATGLFPPSPPLLPSPDSFMIMRARVFAESSILIPPAFCSPSTPAWDDGRIRAFAPETGRLMYVINNAHRIGVTAVATTSDCKRVISGGGEGEVPFLKAESFYSSPLCRPTNSLIGGDGLDFFKSVLGVRQDQRKNLKKPLTIHHKLEF